MNKVILAHLHTENSLCIHTVCRSRWAFFNGLLTLTYSSRRFDCNGTRNGATVGDLKSIEKVKSGLGLKAAHP